MKVKDLIILLKDQDPEHEVVVHSEDDKCFYKISNCFINRLIETTYSKEYPFEETYKEVRVVTFDYDSDNNIQYTYPNKI